MRPFVCQYCGRRYHHAVSVWECAERHMRRASVGDTAGHLGWVTLAWGAGWLVLSLGLDTPLAVVCLPAWIGHVFLIVRRARRESAWLRQRDGGVW